MITSAELISIIFYSILDFRCSMSSITKSATVTDTRDPITVPKVSDPYADCDMTYVGQTVRTLQVRRKEHDSLVC